MNTILDHIHLWTTAQTPKTSGRGNRADNQQLLGIQKLRELILELAVRGKLVPQAPTDEPASVLLKKIEDEKKQLIKEGKIKKQEDLPEVGEDEKPFDLPKGWSFIRFGNISVIERGGSPRPIESYLTTDSDGLNWIKIGDTEKGGKYITSAKEKIRKEGLTKTRMVYSGDFLLTNSMSFGRPYITMIDGCIHDGWLRIHPPKNLDKDYLYYLLSSPYVFNFFRTAAAGAVVMNLNSDKVRELPLVLPPVLEQRRIAAKVDELMALCDQLEQQQTENNQLHQTLVETLLANLTQANNLAEQQEAWQRIANNFDTLFTTEYSIDQLKQTILQLAVMGKLVPQNPADEPASELLKKIAKEKARLVKEGKIKKQAPLPEITEDEKPFQLPKGWEWVRLGSFSEIKGGKRLPNGHSFSITETPYIYIQVTNMKNGTIICENLKYVSKETQSEISRYTISKNDLYITIAGTIGDVGIVPEYFDGMQLTENAAKIVFQEINKTWLQKTLSSKILQDQFIEKTKQLAQPKLALHRIESSCIPLPPLAEQHRIVAKVDELFDLCDALKEQLAQAQTTQNLLAGAVVERALETKPGGKVVYTTNEQMNLAAEPE